MESHDSWSHVMQSQVFERKCGPIFSHRWLDLQDSSATAATLLQLRNGQRSFVLVAVHARACYWSVALLADNADVVSRSTQHFSCMLRVTLSLLLTHTANCHLATALTVASLQP